MSSKRKGFRSSISRLRPRRRSQEGDSFQYVCLFVYGLASLKCRDSHWTPDSRIVDQVRTVRVDDFYSFHYLLCFLE